MASYGITNAQGQFKLNLDRPGEFFFINLNNLAFSDIVVNNESIEMEVYRWNGNEYREHKLLTRGKLRKLNITSMYEVSNRYRAALVGE